MIIEATLIITLAAWLIHRYFEKVDQRKAIEHELAYHDQRMKDLAMDISRMQHRYGNSLQEHASEIHFLKRSLERQIKPVTGEKKILREKIAKEISATVRANMGH